MTVTPEQLSAFADLQHVPHEQLQWLIERSEIRSFAESETFFKQGDPIDFLYIALSGCLVFRIEQNGQFRQVSELRTGGIGGTLPYSRTRTATGVGVFAESTVLLLLHKTQFRSMIQKCYELTEALVHFMTSRVRNFTQNMQQVEKMASLGRISAGLAHELNNPAAAIVRSSMELHKHLHNTPERFKSVMLLQLDTACVDALNDLLFKKIAAGMNHTLSALDKSDAEDALTDWLDDHNVADSFEIASTFVEFGFTESDFEFISECSVNEQQLSPVLNWLYNVLTTEKLVGEIAEASKRMSGIVTAVKSYSHLDKAAEKQFDDIHTGLVNTLTILGHKARHNNVNIVKTFAPDVPPVNMFVGELNQVWTNLIDNALDAMEQGGTLEIKTERHLNNFVKVHIIDSGSGISPNAISKIFDPFFTTKQIGKGTGLGLEAVRRIIEMHNADIKVQSQPGRTEFTVCLPVE